MLMSAGWSVMSSPAPRGQRVVMKRPGKREKRLNVTAGLCENEVIAPVVYDWTTNMCGLRHGSSGIYVRFCA